MNIIRVSTDLECSVHKYPEGSYTEQNKALSCLIGEDCSMIEHVMPRRLYTELEHSNRPGKVPGTCISILIDEEGLLKSLNPNYIGSYLYETERHGSPIVGNILFVGEEWDGDGISFCGIEESVFDRLYAQISLMANRMKAIKENIDENNSHR